MDMKEKAHLIYTSSETKELKIKRLQKILEDCLIEMDADDQNMNPEIDHNISEGYQVAKKYIESLKTQEK